MAKFVGILLLCMVIAPIMVTEEAITRSQVINYLKPCLNYLRGTGANPPDACCNGVRNLNSAAKTTADRREACEHIKYLLTLPQYGGIKPKRGEGLPGRCKVKLSSKISITITCNTIKPV